MSNLRLWKSSKCIVLLNLAITIYFVIFIMNQNFNIHNIFHSQFLRRMENIVACIHQLQHISLINVSTVCTGKYPQHEHIFHRRDPRKLKYQLTEMQRTVLDPGLTQLAVIRMKGLQQIDHQAAGWMYPRLPSKVNMVRHIADLCM